MATLLFIILKLTGTCTASWWWLIVIFLIEADDKD